MTNAVKFGPGQTITVRLLVAGPGDVRGEVLDNGHPTAELRPAEAPDASGGFGLNILDRVARRWGVHDDSTDVWFELVA